MNSHVTSTVPICETKNFYISLNSNMTDTVAYLCCEIASERRQAQVADRGSSSIQTAVCQSHLYTPDLQDTTATKEIILNNLY